MPIPDFPSTLRPATDRILASGFGFPQALFAPPENGRSRPVRPEHLVVAATVAYGTTFRLSVAWAVPALVCADSDTP
jgi:hypothetical protein